MEDVLNAVGYGLEMLGLLIAAYGLNSTWRAHAEPQKQVAVRLRRVQQWIRRRVFRRPPEPMTMQLGVAVETSIAGSATVTRRVAVTPDMTPEQQIAALVRNLDLIEELALEGHRRIDGEATLRGQDIARIRSEVQSVANDLRRQDQQIAVGGVPTAVKGLLLTILGLAFQAAGSFV